MWFSDNYSILCADVSLVKYECLSLFPIAYWKYVTCWVFFKTLLAITERKILPKYTDEAIFINVEPYYSFGIIENGRICFSFCKNYEHLRPRAECVSVGYRSVESLKCSGIGNLVQNVMILWVNNTFNWWPNEL